MNRLEKFCKDSLKDYVEHTYALKEDSDLYITESWFNLTLPNQSHHKHIHPNSIVSGVLYIDVDDKKDVIQFWNYSLLYRYGTFDFGTHKINDFNSEMWWMPAITGRLYLFPSGLRHSVPVNKDREKDRLSMSFNTFIKGNLGKDGYKTKLVIR